MTTAPPKAYITIRDIFRFSFLRYLFRALWLFFPALLFLLLGYQAFWKLTQGRDLMIITLENRDVFFYFILGQIFWSYVTWYSSRLVAKAKEFEQPNQDRVWTTLRVQGPRLLAFSCYSIITLAFLQLPSFNKTPSRDLSCILLLLSIPYYFISYNGWDRFTGNTQTPPRKRRFLLTVQTITWIIVAVTAAVVIFFKLFEGLILLLLVMQQAMVLLLVIRRKLIEAKGESFYQQTKESVAAVEKKGVPEKAQKLLFDKEDRGYFLFFLAVSGFAFLIYLLTIISVSFAVQIGSFPFVLIAFGVLLLLGNTVAFFSVLKHFNFHIVLIGLAYVIGLFSEPHYARLQDKKDTTVLFSQRQNVKEFFTNWINQPERKKILDDPAVTSYPVFISLANGGASRSGYWVASVLSKLEDSTQGEFSKHLFCLSGASGGSVGNAAFFSLLRSRNELLLKDTTAKPFYHAATDYLGSDFLTFTLARMLGPDVFRHIFRLSRIGDRASALGRALENASGRRSFLYDSLAVPFSAIVTQKNQPGYSLPALCINTTRMQDASPAVISNIDLSDPAFNKRIDVLDLLDEKKDIKLSTSIVLGSSFPYVSPAGRIDTRVTVIKKDGSTKEVTEPHYFVDGGYFDNSGAGVVNEMIIQLRDLLLKDSSLGKAASKVRFYILHISNDPIGNPLLEKVNPFVNDLAAPLKTLVGGYGSQTLVNDQRLRNYMRGFYGDEAHYIDINLYRYPEKIHYSMNWVISGYLLNAMQERLHGHEGVGKVLQLLGQ